jgi:hypothetical protein
MLALTIDVEWQIRIGPLKGLLTQGGFLLKSDAREANSDYAQ